LVPNNPVFPIVSDFKISYSSTSKFQFDERKLYENNQAKEEKIYHLHPYGIENIFSEGKPKRKEIIPGLPEEGYLFIGIENLNLPQQLNLLFQTKRSEQWEIGHKPDVKWQYLSREEWIDFEPDGILNDGTKNLMVTGIISFALPSNLTKNNNILSGDNYWIRAVTRQKADLFSKIITIYSNSANARTSTAATPINLVSGFTGVIFKLTFGNTTDFIFSNIFIANMSNLANGQLLFKIPSIQAKLILENSEHNFMVTKVDPNLTETLMYTGTWLSSVDYQAATSAAAAATTAAINAASLAEANAQITAKNLLISQLTLEKTAATSALATHMQTHNTVNTGSDNTGGLIPIPPPPISIPPPPPPPVPAIIQYVNATTNIAAVNNITYAKTGELIGLFTNVNNTTLTEIKLGNTLVPANSYPPTNGAGFMTFTVPAGIGDSFGFPATVSITIKTAGGTATAATSPDYLSITE
jgi:hypothetical protein